jgi:iron complex transport system ATP-binding protein
MNTVTPTMERIRNAANVSGATKALLRVDRLSVNAGDARLLHDVSCVLNAGDVLAVIGANGAGKSTLLSALAGEIKASSGNINFAGRALAAWSLEALAERRALNTVEPSAAFALTAADVVALGRPFTTVDERAVIAALSETQATQWALRDVATLSSGEYLRVQLARSRYQLGNTRDCLWLLDEPCAHLDLSQRRAVLTLIQRVAKLRGWAVVFSTHDPAEAEAIADQVMLMRAGRVLAYGSPNTVLTAENLSACYGAEVSRKHAWVATAP